MKTKKKTIKNKVPVVVKPEKEEEVEDDLDLPVQSLKQQKIYLANSPIAAVVIELIKDILQKPPLVGNSEFETMRNAIIIDTSSNILKDMVDYLEDIRKGALIGK
jgi:hypothetical protein